MCAHSVATHDSLKQALCQGRRRKIVKSVGSDGIESLSEVTAREVCCERQQVKSVKSDGIHSPLRVSASKVCQKRQHLKVCRMWQNPKSVGNGST